MTEFQISEHLFNKLKELSKTSKKQYSEAMKKISEITSVFSHSHYNSSGNLKKAHIGEFVLVFEKTKEGIFIHDIENHSVIHKKLHY